MKRCLKTIAAMLGLICVFLFFPNALDRGILIVLLSLTVADEWIPAVARLWNHHRHTLHRVKG